jgi:hypothetical protein
LGVLALTVKIVNGVMLFHSGYNLLN